MIAPLGALSGGPEKAAKLCTTLQQDLKTSGPAALTEDPDA
jgi:hypothetical protein